MYKRYLISHIIPNSHLVIRFLQRAMFMLIIYLIPSCKTSTQPLYNSDSKIIFISERTGNPDIFSMNRDGINQMNLTRSSARELDFDIYPDGSKIVYTNDTDNGSHLYLMDLVKIPLLLI